ncbi:other/IKS protein kinase [Coprinopsis cinerea okayama7|uniref:non-specific serine/threonine protein kinase n=1 Tax=Coprinopsis cinerea (strain Okayama-7 / 130 / ATCC MYA-4618 / FGSC 9003) TaxID=240176 RepID=D6RQE5_COPC7|nr:other/IKS protein kinase [Coprinopsis cinerea okayama7\|eukprot:XP_002910255.1 other/IKS protein kinase [Coprinopsis cinerea okayama7\
MSNPSSPTRTTVALVSTTSESEWQPILHASNQVVLYNPHSHALTISRPANLAASSSSLIATRRPRPCPYCKQDLPPGFHAQPNDVDDEAEVLDSLHDDDPAYHSRVPNYFQLLAVSNETTSRPSSPPIGLTSEDPASRSTTFQAEQMAEGYFKRFFQEEYKLGMGANGSVYLCQHMLDGNPLGHFAVKKIAVGESHSYLLKILREVRLLERLHHPNIVTYHHSWLETCQFSSFGPRIPTLHVLMQWAEGGSLDDFIDIRQGKKPSHPHIHPVPNHNASSRFDFDHNPSPLNLDESTPQISPSTSTEPEVIHSRSARIRAFRAFQKASPEERERLVREGYGASEDRRNRRNKQWAPVHLLSADEVKSLFQDVVEGLGFLHSKSILHLDLKPGNVLLTWDDGKMIPRAMLSDFGTSRDMISSGRIPRSGNTGTLEYASPESLPSPETGLLQQIDSKSDMWSLGMILHKMLFFKLPYRYASEGDANGEPTSLGQGQENEKMKRLEAEVLSYPGFKATSGLVTSFEARRLPKAFLVLLERLLDKSPAGRPSCDRVVTAVREGKAKLDPLSEVPRRRSGSNSPDALVPVNRKRPSTEATIEETQDATVHPAVSSEDKRRLLGLPPPSEILGPDENEKKSFINRLRSNWNYGRLIVRRNPVWKAIGKAMRSRNGRIGLRIVRSCILVSKILSIPRVRRLSTMWLRSSPGTVGS